MNLSSLLRRSEADTLDFKRENYRFKNGSETEKSELLKDILAVANAWKATEAYIILGVHEIDGKVSEVCGVVPELNDSDAQQFVNSKTNRPISFAVEHTEYEGRQLTIIRVLQKQPRPIFLIKGYGRLQKNVVYIRRGSSTDEASPDEIAEMAKQDVTVGSPDVELRFQITIDAYCFRSEHPLPFEAREPTYFDGFEIIARNNGTALARHIEGAIELPRGVFFDYLKAEEIKGRDILVVIGQTKRIKLEFSNYLREPTHHYLAKPNPLEWKPLLPGRGLELFSKRAVPLRHRLHEIEATLKWELAVDNCGIKRGEIRFADIQIVENAS